MRAHRKGLELVCHVQPDVPDALVGDAGRLRQVLLNLVGNAIKFTEQGEVVIRVEVADDPALEGEVVPAVLGDATPASASRPTSRRRIFRAFEQEDSSTTRRYGGTGLGLTIAARLVALMGGTIAVRERAGAGQHVLLHRAVRAAVAPLGAGRRPAIGRDLARRRRPPACHPCAFWWPRTASSTCGTWSGC